MPATTPIFNFPFPCPGEAITPAAFADLANAIDAKLVEVANDETLALNRPNTRRISALNAAVARGAEAVTTGANSSFTIPTSGVYLVSADLLLFGYTLADPNDIRVRVRQNGTPRFGDSRNLEAFSLSPGALTAGPLVCVSGDTITTAVLVEGAGTADFRVILDAKLQVRIA